MQTGKGALFKDFDAFLSRLSNHSSMNVLRKSVQRVRAQGRSALDGLSQTLDLDILYFVRNGLWIALGYAGMMLLRLAGTIIFAHLAEQQLYGQYQFIITVVTVLVVFSLPNMGFAIMQSVASGYDSSVIRGINAKIAWSVLGSIALLGVAAFFRFVRYEQFWYVFLIAAALFPAYSGLLSVLYYHRGKEKFRAVAGYQVLSQLLITCATVAALLLTKSLAIIIAAWMAAAVIVPLLVYARLLRTVKRKPVDPHVVAFGRHLSFMTVVTDVSPYVDRLVVAAVAGFSGLAVYSIALALASQFIAFGDLLSSLVLPRLSRAHPKQERTIRRLFWLLCVGCALVSAVLVLGMRWLIPLLFSENYAASIPYAQLVSVSLAFFLPSSILHAYFQSRKKTKLLYAYNLGCGITQIILLVSLVPLFGIFGAVASRVILSVLGFLFLTVVFFRSTRERR